MMEWKMLFVQSILILLGISQVTNACNCDPINWKNDLCPKQGKTVIRATAISVELDDEENVVDAEKSAPKARYQMDMERIFTSGSEPLNIDDNIFTMMFPLDDYSCGLPLNLNQEYVVVGMVDKNGILNSNTCELINPMNADILLSFQYGNSKSNCAGL